MKLIIEISEIKSDSWDEGTISLPGLVKDGALNVVSKIEVESIALRTSSSRYQTAEHISDAMLRLNRLEKHITHTIEDFYEKERLTDKSSVRYPLKPLD